MAGLGLHKLQTACELLPPKLELRLQQGIILTNINKHRNTADPSPALDAVRKLPFELHCNVKATAAMTPKIYAAFSSRDKKRGPPVFDFSRLNYAVGQFEFILLHSLK
jgi:hypothetical protein